LAVQEAVYQSAETRSPVEVKTNMKHQGPIHLAIAVPDTEEALKIWRDKFWLQGSLQ